MHENDWRAAANCLQTDPNTMQPEVATPDEVAMALRLCDGCPVRRQCRELAESQVGAYGVHAGEWFGDPPANPAMVQCGWCGDDMDPGPRRTRTYCSTGHRVAAFRAREAVSA